jgi:hypothetical protein
VAASSDDTYDGKSRTVSLINLDDDAAAVANAELTFLPEATLDFGEVYAGEEKTMTVTVVNTSAATVANLTVEVDATSAFLVKASATSYGVSDTLTLAAGQSTTLKVKYTAGVAGDNQQSALTFKDADNGDQVVKVLAMAGSAIAALDGGVLKVKQPMVVASGTDTVDISFDIELNTADPNDDGNTADGVAYQFFMFELTLPSVVSGVVVSTNTARTDGKKFSVGTLDDGNLELTWADLTGEKSISALDGTILTVTATVDVTGAEATYPISLSNVRSSAADGEYSVAVVGATLAVSKYVSVADLDVNGNGSVTFHDIVYLYRYVAMEKRASDGLRPSSFYQLGTGVTIEDVESNIADLMDNGLDVNGTGTVTFHDIVYLYRYVAMEKRADSDLRPSAFYQLGDGVTIENVQTNIESIFP